MLGNTIARSETVRRVTRLPEGNRIDSFRLLLPGLNFISTDITVRR